MRHMPPPEPRLDDPYVTGAEQSPAGREPSKGRGGKGRAAAAAVVMLVALAIIAVIVFM